MNLISICFHIIKQILSIITCILFLKLVHFYRVFLHAVFGFLHILKPFFFPLTLSLLLLFLFFVACCFLQFSSHIFKCILKYVSYGMWRIPIPIPVALPVPVPLPLPFPVGVAVAPSS